MGFLTCFSKSSKTALKNTKNSPLYSILKLTSLKIFKNESFCFPNFLKICSKNFHFILTCFSVDSQKPHLKISKIHLYSILKLTFQELFKNKSSIFLNFLEIFFPTYVCVFQIAPQYLVTDVVKLVLFTNFAVKTGGKPVLFTNLGVRLV